MKFSNRNPGQTRSAALPGSGLTGRFSCAYTWIDLFSSYCFPVLVSWFFPHTYHSSSL